MRRCRSLIQVVLATAFLCSCGNADDVLWVRMSDGSLWKTPMIGRKPLLLFGKGMDTTTLSVSPDGTQVAAGVAPERTGIGLFSTTNPGTRHTTRLRENEWFVGEWSRSGHGILVSIFSTATDMDGTHQGVYEVKPDGRRVLVAPTAVRNQPTFGYCARYSPNGHLLAIQANWVQVVRVGQRPRTILFKTISDNGFGVPPTWIDNDHVVVAQEKSLLVVDIPKQTTKRIDEYDSIASMVYCESRHKLYATMSLIAGSTRMLYSIDPNSGHLEEVHMENAREVASIFGVTNDGKIAILTTACPSVSSKQPELLACLWAVDLDTSKQTLISNDATVAAIFPSAKLAPKLVKKVTR